jgi:hypothetical protein
MGGRSGERGEPGRKLQAVGQGCDFKLQGSIFGDGFAGDRGGGGGEEITSLPGMLRENGVGPEELVSENLIGHGLDGGKRQWWGSGPVAFVRKQLCEPLAAVGIDRRHGKGALLGQRDGPEGLEPSVWEVGGPGKSEPVAGLRGPGLRSKGGVGTEESFEALFDLGVVGFIERCPGSLAEQTEEESLHRGTDLGRELMEGRRSVLGR